MSSTFTIVGNWKMHLDPGQAGVLVHKLDQKISAAKRTTIVLCPPFIDLFAIAGEVDQTKFKLGAQNCHYADVGAFTGEISPAQLKGLADYVILGHSERRQHAGEDDNLIAKKVAAAIRNDLKPVLCVGESLLDRHHGISTKVVIDQLEADLSLVTAAELQHLLVAYEPVWAIGTGEFAKPDQVEPVVGAIRRCLEDLYGESAGSQVQVLYGGSVDKDNCRAYLKIDGVDGLLVGGASLIADEFGAIVKTAQSLT